MAAALLAAPLFAADVDLSRRSEAKTDEFKIKREQTFEFAQKPEVAHEGDAVTITFETKGYCDATVVIENRDGKIICHLASGVLGPNAPVPFRKNSKEQELVWDGKDDRGVYIDDREGMTARVSLGLKPQFERTLHWSPHRRTAPGNRPLIAPAPEGVYVLDGGGVDHVRLFDHEGNYIRTVYPFPPNRSLPGARSGPKALQTALSGVQGLEWQQYPQDGLWLPKLGGYTYCSLLTSGNNVVGGGTSKYGCAASAFAASPAGEADARPLALIMFSLNRMAGDGTTGALPLEGPRTALPGFGRRGPEESVPRSAAFSPDGKWIYLTGYEGGQHYWLPAVLRVEYGGSKPPELFAGSLKWKDEGKDNQHFRCPLSVACDSKGRVYVADSMNHRIQVYTPDGKHFKTVEDVFKPVEVQVHPKSGDIYVSSWMIVTRYEKRGRIKPVLTHYGPLENPVKKASYPLEFAGHSEVTTMNRRRGLQHGVTFDFHTDPPTLWMVPGTAGQTEKIMQLREAFGGKSLGGRWRSAHCRLYVERDGKLVRKRSFADDVAKTMRRIDPPGGASTDRQRMYVNPGTGKLYIAESDGEWVGNAFSRLLEVDPITWETRFVSLPFAAEEIAFDLDGLLYARYQNLFVARYDPRSMREVPFDYGEERAKPQAASVIPLPGKGLPPWFHQGGLAVSPKGYVVASCFNRNTYELKDPNFRMKFEDGKPYTPPMYPGRRRWAEVHVWDRHGKLVYEDAVAGLGVTDGLAMDKDDNIYALVGANRVLDGKPYILKGGETLIKVKARKAKIINSGKGLPFPAAGAARPNRPLDFGNSWIEDAEWMYGGVGFSGGAACVCWNARPALDLLGRSFVTELARFRVAVLDTNGNLILRVGKYGNVDDGVPLIKQGGPANPRAAGGDEVALFHPSYVGTHSDRRLFIADYGNYRILSVKLGYHAEERISLADQP